MTDRMDEIREIVMPAIWDTWCVNDISWSEIFTYLKEHFTNDVLSDICMIAEENVDKYTLTTKQDNR